MKKILLIPILATSFSCISQTFIQLGTDVSGDCTCSCSDAQELSYAFNTTQDSIWFKIVTYTTRPIDYGYHIVMDWDFNQSNGDSWSGASSGPCMGLMNFAINHDRMITAWPSIQFIEAYDQSGGTIINYNVDVQLIDAMTTIIGVRLSDVDANADGNVCVVAGVGKDNYRNFDVLPNANCITTGSTGISESNLTSQLIVFPNPFVEEMIVTTESGGEAKLFNALGEEILSREILKGENRIITPYLPNGIYFLHFVSESGVLVKKVIKT